MRKFLVLAGVAAAITATPAMAKTGGLYVGAIAGYQGIHVKSADGSASASADSAVYGINGGYDLGLGQAFVGVEGEFSTSGGSTRFPNTFTGAYDSLKAKGQYYIGARAGVALTPGIAAYGKVGYTSIDTKAFTSSGTLAQLDKNAGGIRFGGGVQAHVAGPIEARVEYRRSRYKDVNGGYGTANTDQVVGGLAVRF